MARRIRTIPAGSVLGPFKVHNLLRPLPRQRGGVGPVLLAEVRRVRGLVVL